MLRIEENGSKMIGPDSEERVTADRKVEESQEELSRALGDVESIIRRSVNPAMWITRRPLPWLLGVFALGLWLGAKR